MWRKIKVRGSPLLNYLVVAVACLIGIGAYADPFLLLVVWVRRFGLKEFAGFRIHLGWISLGLASAGIIAFFGGLGLAPSPANLMFNLWFKRWFLVCTGISGAALVVGIIGKGKMQWAVVTSAVVTPLSCVLALAFE